MIEIGERTAEHLTYEEAILYCFCLGDGWRLPTEAEYYEIRLREYGGLNLCWYLNDSESKYGSKWYVTPVRDLKDD